MFANLPNKDNWPRLEATEAEDYHCHIPEDGPPLFFGPMVTIASTTTIQQVPIPYVTVGKKDYHNPAFLQSFFRDDARYCRPPG